MSFILLKTFRQILLNQEFCILIEILLKLFVSKGQIDDTIGSGNSPVLVQHQSIT